MNFQEHGLIQRLARKGKLPAVVHQAETALTRLQRGFGSRKGGHDKKVNRVLKRHCEKRFRAEAAELERKREAQRKERSNKEKYASNS